MLGVSAGRAGGTMPAAFNAANEVAVQAFLDRQIGFGDITRVIDAVLSRIASGSSLSLEAVRATDVEARRIAGVAVAA